MSALSGNTDREFKERIQPTFEKIRFNYKEPFIFDTELDISTEDYEYIFKNILHGCIYRTLCFLLKRELTCSQYIDVFNKEIKTYSVFGEKYLEYKELAILKITYGKHRGHRCEIIEALFVPLIISDTSELIEKKLVAEKPSFKRFKKKYQGQLSAKLSWQDRLKQRLRKLTKSPQLFKL